MYHQKRWRNILFDYCFAVYFIIITFLFIQYITRAEDAERELRDVRRDNDSMREDIRDLQRQLDAQRETMVARRDDDHDFRDKIKTKNALISEALDANRVCNNVD